MLKSIEELVFKYDKNGNLPERTLNYWKIESQNIKKLLEISIKLNLKDKELKFFPSTPVFAYTHNLSFIIIDKIFNNKKKGNFKNNDELYYEIGSYYCKAGKSLIYSETEQHDKAILLLFPLSFKASVSFSIT